MSEIQIVEGKMVIEFGINSDGEQGYTINWPQSISSGRVIAALEVIKARAVLDVLQQMTDEEDPEEPN